MSYSKIIPFHAALGHALGYIYQQVLKPRDSSIHQVGATARSQELQFCLATLLPEKPHVPFGATAHEKVQLEQNTKANHEQ
jgi:hypothetical protein